MFAWRVAFVTAFVSGAVLCALVLHGLPPSLLYGSGVSNLASWRRSASYDETTSSQNAARSSISAKDRRVYKEIASKFKVTGTGSRKLAKPDQLYFSQIGQDREAEAVMKGRRNGYFIEVGAYDGETFSNSLHFELTKNWTGLLIEAGEENYRKMLTKNRKVSNLRACLSPGNFIGSMAFKSNDAVGMLSKKGNEIIKCYPLGLIIDSLNLTHIDLLSLDIEGDELYVLSSIPFYRIQIDLMIVEHATMGLPAVWNQERLRGIKQFADSLPGYSVHKTTYQDVYIIHDSVKR